MSELAEDLAFGLQLADLADAITLERYLAADWEVATKPDRTPVTQADTDVEQAIRARVSELRPGDAVLGEEYGTDRGATHSRCWIVDPIDGTKNFIRKIPVWATLLALEHDGEASLGVASAPAMGRRWWAARGQGAFAREPLTRPSRRLQVSAVAELGRAQVSFGGLEHWKPAARRDALLELVAHSSRTRSFGDFWAYMLLAEGAIEVAVDPVASLWDLAAMQVIVEEAGGRFTDLGGVRTTGGGDAIATNGLVHDAALALVGRG